MAYSATPQQGRVLSRSGERKALASALPIVAGDLIDHHTFGFGFVKATFGRLAYVDFGAGERHALPLKELRRVRR